jgi:hypothetical protein
MSWLYNVLTPNRVIELKDMPMVGAKAQRFPEVKETMPDVPDINVGNIKDGNDKDVLTKTETDATNTSVGDIKETETETETKNAMRFTVPSVNYTPTNDKERRTIGYNVPPQNATQIAHHVPDVKKVIETVTYVPQKEVLHRNDIRVLMVKETIHCKNCFVEFTAKTKRALYCSDACRLAYHKKKNKE